MTMDIKMISLEIFLLERQFDREKDPENFREISLSTDRFEKSRLRRKVDRECLIPYLR